MGGCGDRGGIECQAVKSWKLSGKESHLQNIQLMSVLFVVVNSRRHIAESTEPCV